MIRVRRLLLSACIGLLIVLLWGFVGQARPATTSVGLKVYGTSIGNSTRYIGACEGNINFDRNDLLDLQLNTYRIYGGMSRWETDDDDGVYGWPSINQIKANPDIIRWDWWDQVMTFPAEGSDYTSSRGAAQVWQGNARTIFETLRQAHIRPVLTIRNSDPTGQPGWAAQTNPPQTDADWNEWWEHVFATVYWLNVRNDYGVDDFEIHNEPDNAEQGWAGSQSEYFELVRVAEDAIAHVYDTYLPNRHYFIHTPMTVGGSTWVADAIRSIPTYFNTVNVHTYDLDMAPYIRRVHNWMRNTSHAQSMLWVGEWGSYSGAYNKTGFALDIIKNLIRMSQPGDTHVDGSQLFSLYDWTHDWGEIEGLISHDGDRRLSYYAFRMGIRALQGGRPVFLTTSSDPELMAIATQDDQQQVYLLLVNDSDDSRAITADLSALLSEGDITMWEFSKQLHDEVVSQEPLRGGTIQLDLPAHASRLAMIRRG